MDMVFYNYDGTAYAYVWYNYDDDNGYRGQYWETNQPRPYWDTQIDDSNQERSFTVGCSDATQFQPNTLYYWWGYAYKNSPSSPAKVIAQRGMRDPYWIYENTYYVFAEQSYKIIGFDEWYVPGYTAW